MAESTAGLEAAILAVQFINAIAIAGGNAAAASARVSGMLSRKRAAGDQTLTLAELLALMEEGDRLLEDAIRKTVESLSRQ